MNDIICQWCQSKILNPQTADIKVSLSAAFYQLANLFTHDWPTAKT